MVKQQQSIFTKVRHRLGIYNVGDLAKAIQTLRDPKSRRSPILEYQADALNKIVDLPIPSYEILVKLAQKDEVIRTVHEAIIRKVTRNGSEIKERYACKCQLCGAEYQTIKETCTARGCESKEFIYPDSHQKEIAEMFIDKPNRDNTIEQIDESLLRWMLTTDDYWISMIDADIANLKPAHIQVEDACRMRVVWDEERGTIGNGEYFCPICTKKHPTEVYPKDEPCKRHPNQQLKETAYVYVQGSQVKARYARDEIYHGIAHPWLPGFYGFSLILSVLQTILTKTAMNNFNLDNYSTGKLAQILVFKGLTQEEANTLASEIEVQLRANDTRNLVQKVTKAAPTENKARTLFVGGKDGVDKIDSMPDSEKMQSLEWWKLWREVISSVYGVTPIFSGVVESGKTGNNPRMQIDVNNNMTEFYMHKLDEVYNSFILPKLGVTDYIREANPVEEKDEMQDISILQAKLDAIDRAIGLGFNAELTEDGDVKIGGKPKSHEERQQTAQSSFTEGDRGFPQEGIFNAEKGKSYVITELGEVKKSDRKKT